MGDDWFLNRKGWKRQTGVCMSDDQQDLAGHLRCITRQTVIIHLCTEFSQLYNKWNLCTSHSTVEGSSLYCYSWHVNNGKVSENMHTISNKQLRLPKPTAWNVVMNCQENEQIVWKHKGLVRNVLTLSSQTHGHIFLDLCLKESYSSRSWGQERCTNINRRFCTGLLLAEQLI